MRTVSELKSAKESINQCRFKVKFTTARFSREGYVESSTGSSQKKKLVNW